MAVAALILWRGHGLRNSSSAAEPTCAVLPLRRGTPGPSGGTPAGFAADLRPESSRRLPGQDQAGLDVDSSLGVGALNLEDYDGMSQREEFLSWVQTVLRDAEVAVHNGDASARRAIWSRNDPVTVLGAWRNASGQAELDELFAHLAESFSDCTSYEFELLEAEVFGDAAYTVGLEHTSASINGVPRTYTLRATQIYRREAGDWKVAHRHGSAPPT